MRTISNEELRQILENHLHWIQEDCDGWENLQTHLYGANLYGADLCRANMREADLCRADLREADLCRVDLRGANLYGADLREAAHIPSIPMTCPDTGAFVGWKKCRNGRIVKLDIPNHAKRSSATGRKCRCDVATVASIESIDGTEQYTDAISDYDPNFIYRVGEKVCVSNYDDDRFHECAPGIHFFINRQEAVDYDV